MNIKTISLFLFFCLISCSENKPLPVIDSTNESIVSFQDWVKNTLLRKDQELIVDYKLKSTKLVEQYHLNVIKNKENSVQLTDELVNDLLTLTADVLDISPEEWDYLFNPVFSDNIPDHLRKEFKEGISDMLTQIAETSLMITPLSIMKAIPNDLKIANNGAPYANIIENTKYPNFIHDTYWLNLYKEKRLIRESINKVVLSGEINYDTDSISKLSLLRENMINSQIVPYKDIFDFKSVNFQYDLSQHFLGDPNRGYELYSLDSLSENLDKIKGAKLTLPDRYYEKLERRKRDYEKFRHKTNRDGSPHRLALKYKGYVEEEEKIISTELINVLPEQQIVLEDSVLKIEELKVIRNSEQKKYLDYKKGFIKNYTLMLKLFDELEAQGIERYKLKKIFFGVTNNRVLKESDLENLININESAVIRYKGYIWKAPKTEEYNYNLERFSPVKKFISYIKSET